MDDGSSSIDLSSAWNATRQKYSCNALRSVQKVGSSATWKTAINAYYEK